MADQARSAATVPEGYCPECLHDLDANGWCFECRAFTAPWGEVDGCDVSFANDEAAA